MSMSSSDLLGGASASASGGEMSLLSSLSIWIALLCGAFLVFTYGAQTQMLLGKLGRRPGPGSGNDHPPEASASEASEASTLGPSPSPLDSFLKSSAQNLTSAATTNTQSQSQKKQQAVAAKTQTSAGGDAHDERRLAFLERLQAKQDAQVAHHKAKEEDKRRAEEEAAEARRALAEVERQKRAEEERAARAVAEERARRLDEEARQRNEERQRVQAQAEEQRAARLATNDGEAVAVYVKRAVGDGARVKLADIGLGSGVEAIAKATEQATGVPSSAQTLVVSGKVLRHGLLGDYVNAAAVQGKEVCLILLEK
ncbi:hypothetical protein RI054_19g85290 [Pseudoscourfieldia marina]